jgi:iron(II)-dependent oxidoreductase
VSPTELAAVLEHARRRTEALLEPLSDEQLTRQVSPLQSPLVWDVAHIGYFEELWLLRRGNGSELDDLYDSFAHGRVERGTLPLVSPPDARAYVSEVRKKVLERLPALAVDDFLVGMVAQHELQHVETMAQTLALGGLTRPNGLPRVTTSALVTNAEYAEFVEAEGAAAPLRWGREDDPVRHVSFHEAEAYARWVRKRLPTEPEWEKAVTTAGAELEHAQGAIWQWTSSFFEGYPGFRAFPYKEYSEVFFGDEYRVLRGGSWVTDPLVARPTFRNWDLPQRRQIFAGIRCASDV